MSDTVIPGELYAPEEPKKSTRKPFLPKKSNKELFISEDELDDMTFYELKIITLFEISQKRISKDIIKSQQIELSHKKLIKKFPNKQSFYKAIDNLIDKDIIKKVSSRPPIYQFAFKFTGNGTDEDAFQAGLIEDTDFLRKNRMKKLIEFKRNK